MTAAPPAGAGGLPDGDVVQWMRLLRDRFGWRLLMTIFIVHHLLKGFVCGGGLSGILGSAMDFTFRCYGVSGPELQIYTAVAALPWTMKATMGVMSDGFPLLGYRKVSYMVLFGTVASLSLVGLGMCTGTVANLDAATEGDPRDDIDAPPSAPMAVLTFALFCVHFHVALSDLLVEAKYAECIKAEPEGGPDLVTYVWSGLQLGGLAATFVAGWVIDGFGPSPLFFLAAPIAALVAWPSLRNYIDDTRHGTCGCWPELDRWQGNGRVPFFLAIVMGFAGIVLALCSILLRSLYYKFLVAVGVCLLNLILFAIFLRPAIARVNAFFLLQSAFHIGTHGASFYFFTDNAVEFPGGPNFSTRFFVTMIGAVASLFSLVGSFSYNRFAKGWRFRSLLAASSLAYMLVNCLSAIVFLRWNLRVHIPDSLFMVASTSMQSVIGQMSWMPCVVMIAQLCPDGLESTMYALLSGSQNLGLFVSNYAGAYILDSLGVRPRGRDGEGEEFANLWLATLISALGPCIPLLLVNVLVPDAGQTDRILGERDDPSSATAGSLFERWWLRRSNNGAAYEYMCDKNGRQNMALDGLSDSDASVELSRTGEPL